MGGFEPVVRHVQPAPSEIDLSVALDELRPQPPLVPPAASALAVPSAPAQVPSDSAHAPASMEDVFRHLRDDVQHRPPAEAAELSYQRGKALYEAGAVADSVEPLRVAARLPALRHAAASLLARIFREQQQFDEAIEWLGHAADAPVRTDTERHAVLLQLADLLEVTGESTRALAVCLELQSEAGDYGDLRTRILRLSTQGGG